MNFIDLRKEDFDKLISIMFKEVHFKYFGNQLFFNLIYKIILCPEDLRKQIPVKTNQ